MASKDTNISKQGTAGKRKYVTIMIPQKLEATGMLESGKSQSVVMASHNNGSLTRYDIMTQEDHYDYLWHKFKCDKPFEVTRQGNSLF